MARLEIAVDDEHLRKLIDGEWIPALAVRAVHIAGDVFSLQIAERGEGSDIPAPLKAATERSILRAAQIELDPRQPAAVEILWHPEVQALLEAIRAAPSTAVTRTLERELTLAFEGLEEQLKREAGEETDDGKTE